MLYEHEKALNYVVSEKSLNYYIKQFENDIHKRQDSLREFSTAAQERLDKVSQWELNKKYKVLGKLNRIGKEKHILLILRYEDGTQRDERYYFPKIADARTKLKELKEKYSGVDWSDFEEEI